MLAAFAFSCGDGGNRSSERNDGMDNLDNRQPIEPADTTSTEYRDDETDTTSTWDQNRDPMMDEDNTDNNTLDEDSL